MAPILDCKPSGQPAKMTGSHSGLMVRAGRVSFVVNERTIYLTSGLTETL
jgi:hypothetical protein